MKSDVNSQALNIVVAGVKNSGKTSLLSLLSQAPRSSKVKTIREADSINQMLLLALESDMCILLIDASGGISKQIRLLSYLLAFIRIPHVFVVVNKMDRIEYSEKKFKKITSDYFEFSKKLGFNSLSFIPVCVKTCGNIFEKSVQTSWYKGATLSQLLETTNSGTGKNLVDFRLPVLAAGVQARRYSVIEGKVVSGTVKKGEKVYILPSGQDAQIKKIQINGIDVEKTMVSQQAKIVFNNQVTVKKGDMLVRKNNIPHYEKEFEALIYWMAPEPMNKNTGYILRQTNRSENAFISRIIHIIDINTLHRKKSRNLKINETARVEIKIQAPILFDTFRDNRETGRFMLVHRDTKRIAATGIIRGPIKSPEKIAAGQSLAGAKSTNVTWETFRITQQQRQARNRHRPAVFWFTGFSGSGKSTVARALEARLFEQGFQTVILDGDNVRHGLCGDLGFSDKDRTENIRRVSETAKLFYESGMITICTFISPFKKDRDYARKIIPEGSFYEVFVDCDINTCIQRDPKGLYKKALAGKIPEFTGISSHYDKPENPEITINTAVESVENIVGKLSNKIIREVRSKK